MQPRSGVQPWLLASAVQRSIYARALGDIHLFFHEVFVGFVAAGEFEGLGQDGFTLVYAGDHVRAAYPVGFVVVGLRPLGGMVRVRVVEAYYVFPPISAFALDADQFTGIDVVAVVSGVGAGVATRRRTGHHTGAILGEAA